MSLAKELLNRSLVESTGEPIALAGLARAGEDSSTIMFSPGRSGRQWTSIPVEVIEKIKPIERDEDFSHAESYVSLTLKKESNPIAKALASLVLHEEVGPVASTLARLLQRPQRRTLAAQGLRAARAQLTSAALQINVAILEEVNVNRSSRTFDPVGELSVDISPANPQNIAGLTHDRSNGSVLQLFYSFDRGNSWSRTLIVGPNGQHGDPTVRFSATGTLFVCFMAETAGNTSLVVCRSLDGGVSFRDCRVVDTQNNIDSSPGIDKPSITTGIDPTTGRQAVYVAYNTLRPGPFGIGVNKDVVVAGSNDVDGPSASFAFTTPLRISDGGIFIPDGQGGWPSPAVGPNGELYVSWKHNGYLSSSIMINSASNGLWGSSFGADKEVLTLSSNYYKLRTEAQPHRGIDNGPQLAIDRSGGPNHGALYIVYVDHSWIDHFHYDYQAGPPTEESWVGPPEVRIASSRDGGFNWGNYPVTAPVELSYSGNDYFEDITTGKDWTEFLPALAVDPFTGTINVAFYSTEGLPADQSNYWLVSIFPTGSNAKTMFTSSPSDAGRQNDGLDFGDYAGVAAFAGIVVGFWADNRIDPSGNFASTLSAYAGLVQV
jgi:hypothetical protein